MAWLVHCPNPRHLTGTPPSEFLVKSGFLKGYVKARLVRIIPIGNPVDTMKADCIFVCHSKRIYWIRLSPIPTTREADVILLVFKGVLSSLILLFA